MRDPKGSLRVLSGIALLWFARELCAAPMFPSTRWILLSSPLSPTSYEECQALNQKFSEIISQLSADHEECLQGAPRDDQGAGGTCSKTSCQALHTAMDEARKKASREGQTCSARLSAYLEEKRKEAAEAERRRSAPEREAREDDARRTKRDRERAQEESGRKADQDRRERERASERERRDVSDRERRERDARNDEERRVRELADAQKRYELEARLAALREKQAAEQRERDKVDRATYDRLVKEMTVLKDAGNKISTAIDFAKNPFATAAEKASDRLSSAITGKAVDALLPGKEGSDSRYDAVAEVVDSARARALSGNPFAEKVSGVAMEGIHKIHGKLLGELDRAGADIAKFGREDATASRSTVSVVRPVPSAYGGGVSNPAPSQPANNPFNEVSAPTRYYDPDSRITLEVPTGHVLYREPESRRLVVMDPVQITDNAVIGDRPALGERGCSATGVGIVTQVCEKKRRAKKNPFSGR